MSRDAGSDRSEPKKALWAWTFYDWANQSFATVIQTFVFAAYFTSQVAENPERGTVQWGMTVGVASLLIALCGPFLGAVTDRAGRRKPWLAAFTLFSAAATGCLWFVRPTPDDQWLALGLLAAGVFATQMAIVFYDAMLGDLSPSARYGRWSGRGWAMGYAGGICCLVAVLVLFVADEALLPLDRESAAHIRATFPFVSVWLLGFSIPIMLISPDRESRGLKWKQAISEGYGQLRDTLRNIRRYRHLVRFLIAWALYTNGLVTIFALGGVYAAGTFGMDESRILMFGISLSVTAGIGAVVFSWVEDQIGSRTTILVTLGGLLVFSTAILFAPDEFWFWALGLLLGIFVGPAQASSRSYFSHIAPEALRAQMFGLYAFADKSTAFMGPILVAGLTALTGSQRVGMAAIPFFLALGWLVLRTVPAEKEVDQ